jgi:DNA polymerase elongation subunit (family B)
MNFYTHVHIMRDSIYLRGYSNGKRVLETIEYEPYLFEVTGRKSEYSTLDGKPAEKIPFKSMREAKEYVELYKDTMGKRVYGLTNFQYVFLNDEYPGELEYDPSQISVVSLDIETDSSGGFPNIKEADKAITAISISKNGKKIVLGTRFYKSKSNDVVYRMCKDEKDLLNKFLVVWTHEDWAPDVVTGWNVEMFDIPYIYNRIRVVLGEKSAKMLSPWGRVHEREIVRGKSSSNASKDLEGRVDHVYDMVGIAVLDYLQLYKKFSFKNQASYKLDHIANVELGERKLDYSEYGSLNDLYEKNYELFIDYNIHDVVLVDRLEEKLGLIKQVFAMAYDAKVNYVDVLTTVRPWDVIIHNYLMGKKTVIPQFEKGDDDFNLVGGHVKEPQLGMHKWVASFDLNSLYPHLIMQYNISPETFVEKLDSFPSIDSLLERSTDYEYNEEWSYAANGCVYRRDKLGFLPELMQKMYDDRAKYKKMMIEAKKRYEETHSRKDENDIARYHNLQLAKKIQLNSAYGALGNAYFRWFNFDHAEAITTSGQLSIRWIEKRMNEFLNKLLKTDNFDFVIASDTDSIYVNLEPLVNSVFPGETDKLKIVDALDKFIEVKIQPFMDKTYQDLADYMNARQQKMKMKRETIADKGIWIAKKMYMLNAWDIEGVRYEKPKLKVMGIASVRSSTPASCRSALETGITKIMNEDEESVIDFIAKFREEFETLPFEEIAFPRGIKNMNKYRDSLTIYKKATPIQVKGALIYNKFVQKFGNKYMPISDGDKVKFAYLKIPNIVHEHVIAVPDEMPDEFDLNKYLDRDMQFDKGFLEPIRSILEVIGWSTEKKSTLEDFFG